MTQLSGSMYTLRSNFPVPAGKYFTDMQYCIIMTNLLVNTYTSNGDFLSSIIFPSMAGSWDFSVAILNRNVLKKTIKCTHILSIRNYLIMSLIGSTSNPFNRKDR